MNKDIENSITLIENMIDKFQKGSIYAIATRPGIGKTHFCLNVASLFVAKGEKVLYLSDAMGKDEFNSGQKDICSDISDNIHFEEVYKLTFEKLDIFISEQHYDLIVLDPFDIYSLDIDVGGLKDYAKKKNITISLN